jgi:hypothetical protein
LELVCALLVTVNAATNTAANAKFTRVFLIFALDLLKLAGAAVRRFRPGVRGAVGSVGNDYRRVNST